MSDPAKQTSTGSAATWAVFLAVSWTWCIGMFLPVLMVRDYGIWGFVAFAAPNVIGAAAMGWLIATSESSRLCVAKHLTLVRAFSVVTVAFHIWFVWYLTHGGWVLGESWPWLAVGVFSLALFSALRADSPSEALVPYAISVAVIVFSLWTGIEIKIAAPAPREFAGIPALLWLAPVCVFGFLLCPYLDATFHRARQNTDSRAARISFTLGFGVFFFAMVLFTLVYSGLLLGNSLAAPRVLTAIVLHMLVQSGFTCGLHLREIVRSSNAADRVKIGDSIAALGVIAILAGTTAMFQFDIHDNIAPGFEKGYLIFLSSYGLFFPAYVWLVMIPTRTSEIRPAPLHYAVWLFACALAAPMFWLGFLDKREWWLAPGLLIVLAARMFTPKAANQASLRQDRQDPATPPDPTPVLSTATESPSDEAPGSRS